MDEKFRAKVIEKIGDVIEEKSAKDDKSLTGLLKFVEDYKPESPYGEISLKEISPENAMKALKEILRVLRVPVINEFNAVMVCMQIENGLLSVNDGVVRITLPSPVNSKTVFDFSEIRGNVLDDNGIELIDFLIGRKEFTSEQIRTIACLAIGQHRDYEKQIPPTYCVLIFQLYKIFFLT